MFGIAYKEPVELVQLIKECANAKKFRRVTSIARCAVATACSLFRTDNQVAP